MALKPCKECGKEISTDAKACPHCGKRSPTQTTISTTTGLLIILALGSLFALLSSGPSTTPSPALPPPSPPPDTAALRAAQEQRTADSAAAVARIMELRPSFRFSPDSIEGGGWYAHKNQLVANSWDRTHLAIHVAADGRTYLSSDYTGDNWIFHNHITVRIGDRVLNSETIPSYSDLNVHNNSSGRVWETLHLTAGKDNGIMEAIANAPDTATIRVRFVGDERIKDITLSKRDHIAIREGVELGDHLRKVCSHAGRGGSPAQCP